MKIATENFEKIKERIGIFFDWIYKDCEPKSFKVLDESEDEILLEQEFLFYDGKKNIQCWHKKQDFLISDKCTGK